MLGAIIGDMVGSMYDFSPIKTKEFNIGKEFIKKLEESINEKKQSPKNGKIIYFC